MQDIKQSNKDATLLKWIFKLVDVDGELIV